MSESYKSEAKFELPDFYPTVKVIEGQPQLPIKKEFTLPGFKESVAESSNSFFFKPEFIQNMNLNNHLLRSARFTNRPDWRSGREDSSQRVFFGELDLNIDKGPDGEPRVIPIAVKPYMVAKRAAIHEFIAQDLINDQQNMEAFHPIGFWVQDPENIYLLTLFENAVVTLDNVNWNLNGVDPLNDHFKPFDALRASACTLAKMHSKGFVHRDAQIKNMGMDNKGIRIVDLTQMRKFSLSDFGYDNESRLMVLDDFKKLTESVVQKSYLSDVNSENKRRIIESNLVGPYLSMMRHPSLSFAADRDFQTTLKDISEEILDRL